MFRYDLKKSFAPTKFKILNIKFMREISERFLRAF
jgi:hypothetical protein